MDSDAKRQQGTQQHGTQQQGTQQPGTGHQGQQQRSQQYGTGADTGRGPARDLAHEFDALKNDLAQVRRDLKNLADAGRETATGSAGAARDRLEGEVRQLVDRLREASSTAMDGEREMMDDVRRRVGDRPMTSMLTALGVGLAVGWLASRK